MGDPYKPRKRYCRPLSLFSSACHPSIAPPPRWSTPLEGLRLPQLSRVRAPFVVPLWRVCVAQLPLYSARGPCGGEGHAPRATPARLKRPCNLRVPLSRLPPPPPGQPQEEPFSGRAVGQALLSSRGQGRVGLSTHGRRRPPWQRVAPVGGGARWGRGADAPLPASTSLGRINYRQQTHPIVNVLLGLLCIYCQVKNRSRSFLSQGFPILHFYTNFGIFIPKLSVPCFWGAKMMPNGDALPCEGVGGANKKKRKGILLQSRQRRR